MKYSLLNARTNLLRDAKIFRNSLIEYEKQTNGISLHQLNILNEENDIASQKKEIDLILFDIRTKI